MKKSVFIFISGAGSNMEFLIKSMGLDHPGYPKLVVSNNKEAKGLNIASQFNVSAKYIPNESFEKNFLSFAENEEPDLICLAGFMKILSPNFINRYKNKILNIHPSLLPKYKGLRTHERAIESKEKITGCTVHVVNENLDDGPILGQSSVSIEKDDTVSSLTKKVLRKEHILYPKALRRYLEGKTEYFTV